MLLWVFSEDQQLAANLWLLWSVLPSRSHLNDVTGNTRLRLLEIGNTYKERTHCIKWHRVFSLKMKLFQFQNWSELDIS